MPWVKPDHGRANGGTSYSDDGSSDCVTERREQLIGS